ncbi:16S rRNA (uracil(1498)-N(3))-methyltransferase [Desulfobacterales bacterium HSG16]|nr:16S rRNA (uracil(1498)-N(3))-methyltransferase [Desulfobacterales bacterium HSG16]
MRRFFTDQVDSKKDIAVISGSDAKHICDVLRLKKDTDIILFDGTGMEYEAKILSVSSKRISASIIRSIRSCKKESPVKIIMAQALLKEKKMDVLIRHLTELGLFRWHPFIAERSVARPDEKRLAVRKLRWETIARESLKQCRRSKIPEIDILPSFAQVLEAGRACDVRLIFYENETEALKTTILRLDIKKPGTIFAILGPEGGFDETEIQKSVDYGFVSATLGPRILRAETAPIAALALAQHLFGDM